METAEGHVVLFDYFGDTKPDIKRLALELGVPIEHFELEYSGFRAFDCRSCAHKWFYPSYMAGKLHPASAIKKARKFAARDIDRLMHLRSKGATHTLKITPTFPKKYSRDFYQSSKKHSEIIRDFLRRFEKAYDRGKLAASYNVHVWSSKQPWKPHVHGHISMPNIAFKGKTVYSQPPITVTDKRGRRRLRQMGIATAKGKYVRLPHYFNKGSLDWIRSLWAETLASHSIEVDGDVDIHVGYLSIPESNKDKKSFSKLMNWEQYRARVGSSDLWKESDRLDFEKLDKDFLRFLLRYRNRGHTFGFMARLSQHGHTPSKCQGGLHCPHCNGELRRMGWYKTYGEIPYKLKGVIRTRKGLEVVEPPPFE